MVSSQTSDTINIRPGVSILSVLRHLNYKPWYAMASTLGNGWEHSMEESYDEKLARETLQFFDYRAIPSIPCKIPEEITDVRFRCNLSRVQPIAPNTVSLSGKLMKCATNRKKLRNT